MKILAGIYKGKTLVSLSENTKPTSSFVKTAVFNMLFKIEGEVLDLFAGSGSYGFEALSRGALKVYLNDKDKEAYKSLIINKKQLNDDKNIVLSNLDYTEAILKYQILKINFNITFLDPPYNFTDEKIEAVLNEIAKISNIIVLEREKSSKTIELTTKKIVKEKTYGIKKITIYQ